MHTQFAHPTLPSSILALSLSLAPAALALAAPATDLDCIGCVQATDLAANSVDATKIKDASVSTADLAASSVDATKLKDGSVGAADLAASSVDAAKLKDGSVGTADLAANSVDATKIKDGSIGTADLAASSVDATKLKDGSVGLADLAANSVDSSKVVNGSIAQTDLNAALLARLAAMEADIAALKGGTYSKATLKGTYRCLTLDGEVEGNGVYGQSYAEVHHGSASGVITADGAGRLTSSTDWFDAKRNWWVAYNAAKSANYLGTTSVIDPPETSSGTVDYSVAADGKLTFAPPPATGVIDEGWVGPSGEVLILRYVERWVDGNANGVSQSLSACVRTAR